MSMDNLIEYSDAHSKASGNLWQYYRDEPAVDASGNVIDFPAIDNNSNSFKRKQKIIRKTGNRAKNDVEIMVPLNYVSTFWITLEMPLINCETTPQLTCFKKNILAAN